MIGFDYGRLNEYRIKELRQEAVNNAAARRVGATVFAKRVAMGLRNLAARIDGNGALNNAQPQMNQLRSFTR